MYEDERASFTPASSTVLVTKGHKQLTGGMVIWAQDSRGARVPWRGRCGGWSTLHLGPQETEQVAHVMTDWRQRKEGIGRGQSKTASKDMLLVTYILQRGSISYFSSPTDKTMLDCESSRGYSIY